MTNTAGLVTLASIVPPDNHEVGAGFEAVVDGETVQVKAVLERTAVVEHASRERSVVRKDLCLVLPAEVGFVPGNPAGVGPRQWRRLPAKPPAPPTQS